MFLKGSSWCCIFVGSQEVGNGAGRREKRQHQHHQQQQHQQHHHKHTSQTRQEN